MNFFLHWLIFYASIMFAMCVDNIFWIGASPEYQDFKKWNIKKKLNYIITFRIKTVLSHPRDIFPAIITSFILAIIFKVLL